MPSKSVVVPFRGKALAEVVIARAESIAKHGPLKPGADRWACLISEEYREVCDELIFLGDPFPFIPPEATAAARVRAINELAQLAQLCIGVIELLQAEEATHGSR